MTNPPTSVTARHSPANLPHSLLYLSLRSVSRLYSFTDTSTSLLFYSRMVPYVFQKYLLLAMMVADLIAHWAHVGLWVPDTGSIEIHWSSKY